jgi:hypothetical protein
LLLSQAFSMGIPRWMGFRLSGSLFSWHFSFFTMEFRLSRSLFHEPLLFSRWNSGYHEAFFTNHFFFHDGILAIMKPFSRITSFFTMELWLSRSLFHEPLFFTMEFSRHKIRNMHFGGRLFSYIYRKEYLHRIRLVKNLASWFRAPFARKRVRSSLF